MSITIKRNIKDSVFTHLFQEPKYIVELYKALHPEVNNITEEDIEIVTIENVLSDGIYNDLGFLVNNSLIVLAEAQSTWSEYYYQRSYVSCTDVSGLYFAGGIECLRNS